MMFCPNYCVVYRITQWMEKGIFPQLISSQSHHTDPNRLHSFQFCILSTNLKLTTEGGLIRTNDSLEIFHFHLISSEKEEIELDRGKKPLVGQLKAALENITHCLEETRTRKKSVVSVNIIMEFKDCTLRDEVADEKLSGERDEERGLHSDDPVVHPELFSRSHVSHPLGMLRVVRDNKRGSNDIVEIDQEICETVERSCRHDNSTHADSQSKFSGVDQLAQSSQSQESNCLEEGRRDIGRVDLPHHTVVISREYRMLDYDLNSGDKELGKLFPDHCAQVKAVMNDDPCRKIEREKERQRENVTPVKSPLASIGSGKKRKRSTPPLTPMRIRHNQDKSYKMPPSSYSPKLKIRLERTTSEDFDTRGQERTPVNSRNRDASQSSPMRASSLFITPKSRSGKKQSPRSGSPSEAPTLVVPFSSGKKNSVIGGHLASLSSIPRPTFDLS